MLKVPFLMLAGAAIAVQGLSFPNLLAGVKLSAPPGLLPISSSWGSCRSTTEGAHGLLQSNKDCVTGKLQDFGYPDEAIEALLTAANSGPGARHPLRQGDEIVGVGEDDKKRMCKAAADCECSITQDWCGSLDKKKNKKKKSGKKGKKGSKSRKAQKSKDESED